MGILLGSFDYRAIDEAAPILGPIFFLHLHGLWHVYLDEHVSYHCSGRVFRG